MSRAQYEQQGAREAWEQQEQVTGYVECPYCSAVYSLERSDCDGTDLVCCGEIGHCTPYFEQEQHENQRQH